MADGRSSEPKSLLSTARRLAEEGRHELALAKALEAFEHSQGDAVAARVLLKAYGALGKVTDAQNLGQKELARVRQRGDKRSETLLLIGLSDGVEEKSLHHAQEALRVAREIGDKPLVAEATLRIADASLKSKGDAANSTEQAKQAASDALSVFRDLGDAQGEARALHSLAAARVAGGALDGALRAAREAAAIFDREGLRLAQATELRCIAAWLIEEGEDSADAVVAASEAMDILAEVFVFAPPCECAFLETLVKAHMQAKDMQKALKSASDGFERFQDAGDKRGEGAALELVSMVQARQGYLAKAARTATKATYAYEDAGDDRGRATALRSASRVACRLGFFDKALRIVQDAMSVFEDLDDLSEQASTLQLRAEVFLGKGDPKSAARCAIEARELFQDAKDPKGEAAALLQLCSAELASGDLGRAARTAEEAQTMASQSGDLAGEAAAYRIVGDINMKLEQYDIALKAGQRALALYRELGDCRVEEVSTLMHNSAAQTMLVMKKEQEGRATEKSFKDGTDKALKSAKEALSLARKIEDVGLMAAALYTMAQCYTTTSRSAEAMKAADESIRLFKQVGDLRGEAGTLVVVANIQLQLFQDFQRARDSAEEAVWLTQQASDTAGEARAWEMVDHVEAAQAELRKQQQMLQQQNQMAVAMAQMPVQPVAPQAQEEAPAQMPSMSRPGYDPKLGKLDLSAGLSVETVHKQIAEVAKGLIGIDEEIEIDMPLMEAGLTSNTAVLLRDALMQQMPGISLPVTLTFDYPSIGSMTDLVLENAAKIKR